MNTLDNGGGANINIRNGTYVEIIKDIIKPEYVYKLFKWTNSITEANKKVSVKTIT